MMGVNMGSYSLKIAAGDTCHPRNRVVKNNCKLMILEANMGSYIFNNAAGDTWHTRNRVGKKTNTKMRICESTWGDTASRTKRVTRVTPETVFEKNIVQL